MNAEDPIPSRLKAGNPGLGEPASVDVEKRAEELARSDGRDSITDSDLHQAAEELAAVNTPPDAPEATEPGLGELTAWDDPAGQSGRRISTLPLEDEVSAAEQLVQDGLEEADHTTRAAAGEEDDEDEVGS